MASAWSREVAGERPLHAARGSAQLNQPLRYYIAKGLPPQRLEHRLDFTLAAGSEGLDADYDKIHLEG
jgi:hypothetical protein